MSRMRIAGLAFGVLLSTNSFARDLKVIYLGKKSYFIVDGGLKHGLAKGSKVCVQTEGAEICGEVRALRQRLAGVKVKSDELANIQLEMKATSPDFKDVAPEAGDAEKAKAELKALTNDDKATLPVEVPKGLPTRLFVGGSVGQETVSNKYLASEFNGKSLILIAKLAGEVPFAEDSMLFNFHAAYHRFALAVEETEVDSNAASDENTKYYGEPDVSTMLSFRLFTESLNASAIGLGIRYMKLPAITKEGDDTGAKEGTVATTGPELGLRLGKNSDGSEIGVFLGIVPTFVGKSGKGRVIRAETYWGLDVTETAGIRLGIGYQKANGTTLVSCADGTCSDKNTLTNTQATLNGAITLKF